MDPFYLQVLNVSYALYLLLLFIAAAYDLWKYIIPNAVTAALIVLFFPTVLLLPLDVDWLSHGGAAAVVLAVGVVAYRYDILGAGDVKLLAALALWAGFGHLLWLVMWTALAGGALTLTLIAARRLALALTVALRPSPGDVTLPRLLVAREKVPYGVAIAIGAAIIGHALIPGLGIFL